MIIKDHWYRPQTDANEDRCGFTGCGKARDQHVESVGEWIWTKPHLAVPHPLSLMFCFRCGYRIGHSVHLSILKGLRK